MNTQVQITKFENLLKVFSIGHYFVWKAEENLWKVYRVNNAEGLFYVKEVTVPAGQTVTLSETDLKPLEPPSGQMYGFIIAVQGNVKVRVNQPLTTPKWGVGSLAGEITEEISSITNPNPLTFTITLKGNPISMQVENPTSVDQVARIYFIGAKYEIMEIAEIRGFTREGVIFRQTNPNFPTAVVREVIEMWKYGRIPEISTRAVTK